jgi:hypothetical protein
MDSGLQGWTSRLSGFHFVTSLSQLRSRFKFAGLDLQVIRFPFCDVTVTTPDWIQACRAGLPGRTAGFSFFTITTQARHFLEGGLEFQVGQDWNRLLVRFVFRVGKGQSSSQQSLNFPGK